MMTISTSDALQTRHLFGSIFAAQSWALWRAVLKAANAEPLTADEATAFRAVAERDPPTQRVKELVAIVGRGGGKDSIASFLATLNAINFNPKDKLRPGEVATVMCLANDRKQSGIVFGYIRGYFETVPALAKMVKSVNAESIELNNRVVIEVHANSYRSVRGPSLLCAILDECAFYRSETSANPDTELYGALRPALARVPGSTMILISTAHKRSGLLYQKFKDYYGKADSSTLVVLGTTLQFNPSFDAQAIADALVEDPQQNNAEYNSIWRDDISSLIPRELVEAATDNGVIVRPPQSGIRYVSFVDPSGGGADSFTAAIAHRDGDAAVLDCLIEIRGPCNPEVATADIAKVLKSYRIRKTTGDRYAKDWPVTAFARNGITLAHTEMDRSTIYLECLPLFSSGRARLLDNQKLASQFWSLERRTFSSGQDKIDHPKGAHDDCANAAAGALVLAAVANKTIPKPSAEMMQRLMRPSFSSAGRIPRARLSEGRGAAPMKSFFGGGSEQ
jgi:hypothetical protein